MKEAYITVDIYCNWEADPQAYRIYVDDDLLTERTYLWRNTDQYVQENIVISVEPGTHTFRLEPVNKNFTGFSYRNFAVDHKLCPTDAGAFIVN